MMKRGRQSGIEVINRWLNSPSVSAEERQKFHEHVKKYFHDKEAIQRYLENRGVEVNLKAIHNWMVEQDYAGDQARFFNRSNIGYQGVELVPGLEAMFAQMSRVAHKYLEVIDAEEDISLELAVQNLPLTVREIRSIAEVAHKLKKGAEVEALILAGASRMLELVMNSPTVKDKPEEQFISKTMQAALLRVIEEVEQEKKKIA